MFNLFCHDVDRQFDFYQRLLGLREIAEASSPIYRVLTDGVLQIGFNGLRAYELMDLQSRQRDGARDFAVTSLLTFVVDNPVTVDDVAQKVTDCGGLIVKGPFPTYYSHWQLVASDPEGNVLRLTCPKLPPSAEAPKLDN